MESTSVRELAEKVLDRNVTAQDIMYDLRHFNTQLYASVADELIMVLLERNQELEEELSTVKDDLESRDIHIYCLVAGL